MSRTRLSGTPTFHSIHSYMTIFSADSSTAMCRETMWPLQAHKQSIAFDGSRV